MTKHDKITPCLWFDERAEEAVDFYISVFGGRILEVSHYAKDMPLPEGTALLIVFEMAGRQFQALNGGPVFQFTEAISLSVECETQAEVDRLWTTLTADGGAESQCGWLKDKYGLSWQIVPSLMARIITDPDKTKVARAMGAMMAMKKLDIAKLEAAFNGT